VGSKNKSDTGNNIGRWNNLIISVDGKISKSLKKYLRDINGKHEIKEQQKTAILGTAHIRTSGSANVKVQNTYHETQYYLKLAL